MPVRHRMRLWCRLRLHPYSQLFDRVRLRRLTREAPRVVLQPGEPDISQQLSLARLSGSAPLSIRQADHNTEPEDAKCPAWIVALARVRGRGFRSRLDACRKNRDSVGTIVRKQPRVGRFRDCEYGS